MPSPKERDTRLAAFSGLGADFALLPREPGLNDVHMFNIASTMSLGPCGASINAMTTAVPKLVMGLLRGLFTTDVERHWQSLLAYDVKQAVIQAR